MTGADDETDEHDDETESEAADSPPPVSREQFFEWRSPRLGATNPEAMTNPVWVWLVESGFNAWRANKEFDGPSALGAGPGWCFERFGRSTTELPDGRTILVAGEHEDHYDPDFYIYNDVVVRHPDGRVEIFGYPREVFPPTDFHSATLVGDRIILIGNLGYPRERNPAHTQVLALELETFAVREVVTSCDPPGWIHEHTATLAENGRAILVQHGKLDRGEDSSLVENIDDWRLDLETWQWTRLTERRWPRRELRRSDGRPNHLWEYQQACWFRSVGWEKDLQEQLASLTEELGTEPDLALAEQLFRPSVAHEALADDDDAHDTVRIMVEGVVVRFVNTMYAVQMTVEGDLPQETVDAIAGELRDRLSVLENTSHELTEL